MPKPERFRRRYLSAKGIEEACSCVRDRVGKDGVSVLVSRSEIAANTFNLSVTRYVRRRIEAESTPFHEVLDRFAHAIAERNDVERRALELIYILNNRRGEFTSDCEDGRHRAT